VTGTTGKQRLEILDVVDTQNRIVGRADRPLIHHLGLRHRAVHVLIFNRIGQVFVQLRSLQKKSDPGLWDSSVSGHVDHGETCRQAVVREMQEEVGVTAVVCLQFVLPAQQTTGYEFSYVYQCFSDGPIILQQEEISDGRWLLPGQLTQELATTPCRFSSSLQLIWEYWLGRQSISDGL